MTLSLSGRRAGSYRVSVEGADVERVEPMDCGDDRDHPKQNRNPQVEVLP